MLVFPHVLYLMLKRHRQAEVFAKVEELFRDAPDLSSFRDFLPGAGSVQESIVWVCSRNPALGLACKVASIRARKVEASDRAGSSLCVGPCQEEAKDPR
jgi:histone deacetylase complex regulatory component SIN3